MIIRALMALGTAFLGSCASLGTRGSQSDFRFIAFFTARQDQAHISFVHEANKWFPEVASTHHFIYYTTSDWQKPNSSFLANYHVVVFLDTRPDGPTPL